MYRPYDEHCADFKTILDELRDGIPHNDGIIMGGGINSAIGVRDDLYDVVSPFGIKERNKRKT